MSIQIFVPDIKNNRVVLNPDNSIAFQQWTYPIRQDITKGSSTRYNPNKPIDQMDMLEIQDAYQRLYEKYKTVIDNTQTIRDQSDKKRMYAILEHIDKLLIDMGKTREQRVDYLTTGQLWQEYHRLMEKYDLIHKTIPLGSEEQQRYVLVCRKAGLDTPNNAGTTLSLYAMTKAKQQNKSSTV